MRLTSPDINPKQAGISESCYLFIFVIIIIYHFDSSLSCYLLIHHRVNILIHHHVPSARIAVHPIPITRFRSFRTQPLEHLSAAVKLPIKKRFLGNPTLGNNLVRENLVMGSGCTSYGRANDVSPSQQFLSPIRYVFFAPGVHVFCAAWVFSFVPTVCSL